MKKAVISTGNKQYLVSEGETLSIELLKAPGKNVTFTPLLVIEDDGKTLIGKPELKDNKVEAEVLEAEFQSEKVTSIRYKAKKRVHTVKGHRQKQTSIRVKSIK
jgi:large subunit ribosomal protein L21